MSSPVIAVMGATGGCGVTTIAVHAARALESCVVECGTRAGLAERLALDRGRLVTWGPDDADDEFDLVPLPMRGGYRAVFARALSSEGADRVIAATGRRFRSVVLDLPFGEDPPIPCHAVVVVLPATLPGALRARGVVARLHEQSAAVIANRLGAGGETRRAELQRVVGRKVALELPACAALRDAEDDGALLGPGRTWSRRLARVARVLSSVPPGAG